MLDLCRKTLTYFSDQFYFIKNATALSKSRNKGKGVQDHFLAEAKAKSCPSVSQFEPSSHLVK